MSTLGAETDSNPVGHDGSSPYGYELSGVGAERIGQ